MADDLIGIMKSHKQEIRSRFKVKSLGLFGSYARGDARQDSDLDVLVEFEQAPTLFSFVELKDFLSDITGKNVDLVMKSALRPSIGRRIIREAVPV
jgi:predicted nucleotidyltransferase